jgi:hypothetical protein
MIAETRLGLGTAQEKTCDIETLGLQPRSVRSIGVKDPIVNPNALMNAKVTVVPAPNRA